MPEVTRPRASEPPPPSEQSRPEPQVTQTRPAPVAVPPPVAVDRRPDPALVAELERIGAAASRMTAEMARDRDLRAADLAFAQGHLTTPPDASAYLLYSRVLEVDPGSTEAARGLQSVRQGLINRAMAQIAGNTLDDARRSLQAAEEAGANPMLVADLLAEVDYRQRAMSYEPDGSRR
jgi:hypothetical protein